MASDRVAGGRVCQRTELRICAFTAVSCRWRDQDRIFADGGTDHCLQATLWVFDRDGRLEALRSFDLPQYEESFVNDIWYDEVAGQYWLLARVITNADAGPGTSYLWRLNTDLDIDFGREVAAEGGPMNGKAFFEEKQSK